MAEQLELTGFERVTRFTLEGITFSSQRRRCGKSTCRCVSGDPETLHGPYWYGRFQSGEVRYYGRSLPPAVVVAWSNMQDQRFALVERIERLYDDMRALQGRIDALRLLQSGGALNQKQKLWIEASGFFDCLVSEALGSEIDIQDDLHLGNVEFVKSYH